ncbi:ImmA/IrrE family metallo-endopeptidase [Desulfolucanica intricata]|uniref:ImmA/IrrE family metallo-endopeptidase n=1 Tax=Desulfolucanica intricata TaxID=1285191 RepID=UPI0008301A8A|nr:ImmA/IrrE family metallo-endopeptidase [Desulfolucanica intricata]
MILSIENLLELTRKLEIIVEYRDLHHEQHPGLDAYADAEKKLIVLDISLKDRLRHYKCVLAEEIGHILFPPRPGHVAYHMRDYQKLDYNNRSNIRAIVAQDERMALSWAANILIPDSELETAIKNGVDSVYTLCEWFDVEVWFMLIRLDLYKKKFGKNGEKNICKDII